MHESGFWTCKQNQELPKSGWLGIRCILCLKIYVSKFFKYTIVVVAVVVVIVAVVAIVIVVVVVVTPRPISFQTLYNVGWTNWRGEERIVAHTASCYDPDEEGWRAGVQRCQGTSTLLFVLIHQV